MGIAARVKKRPSLVSYLIMYWSLANFVITRGQAKNAKVQ
jgi:hypothetical protein